MACGLGFTPAQCAEDHWRRVLGGTKEPNHWRAPCPVCKRPRNLEISLKGGGVIARCWTKPVCDKAELRDALDEIVPCRTPRKRRRPAVDYDELTAILLDKSLPPNAMRLGGLRALGMPEKQIKEKLAFPRQTYYDAVRILGQRRR